MRADIVGIVGAGRFGTRARLGARARRPTRARVVAGRRRRRAIQTTRSCPRLPEAALPEPLEATDDPRRLASEARLLVMAVSSTTVRERARELGGYSTAVTSSFTPSARCRAPNNERVSEVMQQGLPTLKIGVIAGPALPDDLALGEYASMVVASAFDEVVAEARRLLNAPPRLRVYGSKDLAGVELASRARRRVPGRARPVRRARHGRGSTRRVDHARRRRGRAAVRPAARGAHVRRVAGLGNLLVRATERSADYQLGRAARRRRRDAPTTSAPKAHAPRSPAPSSRRKLRVRMPVLAASRPCSTARPSRATSRRSSANRSPAEE